MGLVCPLGSSPGELWEALAAGRSGVDFLSMLPQLEGCVVFGGEARQFTGAIDDFGQLNKSVKKTIRKALKVMCRETKMAIAVAQHAAVAGEHRLPVSGLLGSVHAESVSAGAASRSYSRIGEPLGVVTS